ncbi:MAG: hypothetical protein IIW01_00235 [Thermoguttaceae bacterium]|nr:hypothetical protein [Thermoguttaceae bacterium]
MGERSASRQDGGQGRGRGGTIRKKQFHYNAVAEKRKRETALRTNAALKRGVRPGV